MVPKFLTGLAHVSVSFNLWKQRKIVGIHTSSHNLTCLTPRLTASTIVSQYSPLHFSSVRGAEVRVLLLRYR